MRVRGHGEKTSFLSNGRVVRTQQSGRFDGYAAQLFAQLEAGFHQSVFACFLHDNAKKRPSLDGLNVPCDAVGTPVLHQFLGAEKARRDFDIQDEDVLDAIRFHTTAKANMTMLEKLVYTADSVSFDRDYEPIPKIREIAMRNFDEGFKAVLKYTYDKVGASGKPMHPLTQEAVKCYLG